MGRIRIKNFKLENLFRNVICNFIIIIMIGIMIISGINIYKHDNIMLASNSEYNGTIYGGDKNSKKLSLMINVYWGNEYVEEFLKIFKKYGIKTTFFIGGSWANQNIELLKKIYDYGHEIGSHGYSHKEHGKCGYETNLEEISKCHTIIKDILGIEMNLFAPPGGSYNSSTIKSAESLGYKTIMWTRDTIDWRDHNSELIYNRAITSMQGGDLILMHPTKNTIEALEKIIEYSKNCKLEITTVSDVLDLKC